MTFISQREGWKNRGREKERDLYKIDADIIQDCGEGFL